GEVVVSLAHTNASYEDCVATFELGASHATHLYNAMKPQTHRTPNAVGAVLDRPGITAELICDGLHLHPAIVRTAMRLLGPDRPVFISDSMMAAGLNDGVYDLGGLSVNVKGREARLVEGGNIAGSVSNLADCVRIAVKNMDVPLADAVRCASTNPARVIGIDNERGRIAEGMIADLLLLDEDLNVKDVFVRGRRL
ncbi:MAG: amidohydrolase family protein, partial [Oscillospiraceae bacterium]|nr:amidohydrolase family protein [Oscillospiraceae bacterium]